MAKPPTDREVIQQTWQSRGDWERDINQSKGGPYQGKPPSLDGGQRDKKTCTLWQVGHPTNTYTAEVHHVTDKHFIVIIGHYVLTIGRTDGRAIGLYYMKREEVDRLNELLEPKEEDGTSTRI